MALGVARTFQNIRLFKKLSVLDNVKMALNNSMNYNTFEAIFRLPRFWKEEKEITDRALDLLDIFDMAEMANIISGNLSRFLTPVCEELDNKRKFRLALRRRVC